MSMRVSDDTIKNNVWRQVFKIVFKTDVNNLNKIYQYE